MAPTSNKKPARVRLKELRARAGLSARDIAKKLDYASGSGYHKYEREAAQKDRPIPLDVVRSLIPLFRGLGNPAITVEEVMALTDMSDALPRSHLAQYLSPTVDDGKGLLIVRYRVEPNVYVQEQNTAKQYGASRLGSSIDYDVDKQWVAVCSEDVGDWYKKGSQLHCVDPEEFPKSSLRKRRVVIASPYKGSGELVEIVVARVTSAETDNMVSATGVPVYGRILGVVIGAYSVE